MTTIRCLVTGVDPKGRSVLVADSAMGEAAPSNIDLWRATVADGVDGASPAAPFPFHAAAGEVMLRVVVLPPSPPGATRADAEAAAAGFFAAVGAEACRIDTTRDPWMHRTPTLDYVALLSGEVSLLLDVGDPVPLRRHDVVVQRGANHSWVNTGTEPATMLVVMVGQAPARAGA